VTAWALALVAASLYGLGLTLTQFGLRHMPPALGAAVSVPSAALALWCAAPVLLDAGGWQPAAALIFAAVGLMYPAVATLLTFAANQRMGPSVTGALGNLAPLFAVAFAVAALGENLSAARAIGVVAIVAGVTLLASDRRWLAGNWPLWLMAIPLFVAVIRGVAQPAIKAGLAIWPDAYAATLIGYTVSTAVIGSQALLRARGLPRGFTRPGIGWFAAVGLSNSLALVTTYAALTKAPVTLVAPLVGTYPLFTLALSAVLLRAVRASLPILLGVAATVAGVALLLARPS
jgi:drug/metabolite transporter (DMT)-like permease